LTLVTQEISFGTFCWKQHDSMTYGCKIMVSLTLCSFFGPPCR